MGSPSLSDELVALRAGEIDPETILETHLARILVSLARERVTGVLEVIAEGEPRPSAFYLKDGVVVFADAGMVGETLGRVLMGAGQLSEDEYTAILRRMTDALVHEELMRFGQVAIELGLLSPEVVSEGLARQVQSKLIRCLQIDHGRWVFREDPEAVARVGKYRAPIERMLGEALAEPMEASRWVSRLEPVAARSIALAVPGAALAEKVALPPASLRIVRELDGSRTVADVLRTGPDVDARAATIATLLLLELASLVEAPRARPVSRATAVMPPPPDGETVAKAALTAEALRLEFEQRRAATAARPPAVAREEQRSHLTAEQRYLEGRKLLRDGKLAPAIRELEAASAMMPQALEYRVAIDLARWLAAQEGARRDHADLLRESALATLKADRRCALAHYAIGRLTDDPSAALRAFTNASRLDPQEVEYQRWMRVTKTRVEREQ